jgi:hypothetical protein
MHYFKPLGAVVVELIMLNKPEGCRYTGVCPCTFLGLCGLRVLHAALIKVSRVRVNLNYSH